MEKSFFWIVHLSNNIRNNLLNKKRFVFPSFSFSGFCDDIHFTWGKFSKKLLNIVYGKDEVLGVNFKKASKVTTPLSTLEKFEEHMSFTQDIFHDTTMATIKSYFPNRSGALSFLELFTKWWVISNSKNKFFFNIQLP